jgi:TamB, inner membrane protein subunit of TAM complex
MARLKARMRLALIVAVAIAVGAAGTLLLLTRTQAGQTLVMNQVLKRIEGGLQGQIVFGSVHSKAGLHRQATLVEVAVSDRFGSRVFSADSLSVSYSVRGLISGDILLTDVELWSPFARLSRPGVGEPYGIQTLLAAAPDSVSLDRSVDSTASNTPQAEEAVGGGVRRMVLQNVGIHSGRIEIRDPLPAGTFARRVRTEPSPDGQGLIRVMDFEDVNARLTRVSVVDPDVDGILVDVAGLATSAAIFDAPLVVGDFSGRVRYQDGRLTVRAEEFRMPVGTEATGSAAVDWTADSPEVELDLAIAKLETRDLRWLMPDFPAASGATALRFDRDASSMEVRLNGGHLHFAGDSDGEPGGGISGDATFRWVAGGQAPSLTDTSVELDDLGASIVEHLFGVQVPFRGAFGGNLSVEGDFGSPFIEGTLTHRRPDFPLSVVEVSGRLLLGDDPGAENLDVTLQRLSLGVVEAYARSGLNPGRTLRGTASLNGRLSTGLGVYLRTRYPAPEGETSVVALTGTVRRSDGELQFDLSGSAEPLWFPGVVREGSSLARLGRATGTLGVSGPISELSVVADLETPQGRLSITAGFDGRDPFSAYDIVAIADDFDATVLLPTLPEGTSFNGRVDVSGEGRGLDEAVLSASARLRDAKFAHLAVDSLAFEGTIRDGLIRVDSLTGVVGRMALLGSGTLGTSRGREGRLDLELRTDDLEGIRPFFLGETVIARDTLRGLARDILVFDGIDPDTLPLLADVQMSGSVTAQLQLNGALDSLSLSGELTVADAVYAGSFVERAHVTFTADGLPSVAPQIQALVESGGIRILERAFDSVSVRLDYQEPRGRTDIFLVRSEDEDYRAHIAFDWSDTIRVLNVDEMTLRFPTERWNLGGPATVSWDPDGLTFRDVRLIRPGTDGFRMSAEGRLPFRGAADFDVSVQRLELARVAHLFQLPDRLEGVVDLELQMRGTAQEPELEGTASAEVFRFRDFAIDKLRSDFTYAGRRLSGSAQVRQNDREILALDGTIPADLAFGPVEDRFPDEAVDLDIRADSLPVALLMAPFPAYDNVHGSISGAVSLGGTLEGLAPDGEVRLSNAGAYLESVGVRHQGIEGVVTLHPDGTLGVQGSVHARGSADVTGTITLSPASNPSLDLRVFLRDFQALERRDVEARLSGTVDIRGAYRSPVVSGDLDVREGVLFVEEFIRSASVLDLGFFASDSTSSILDPDFLDAPSIIGGESPFLRNVVMRDLTLRFTNNAWVQSADMRVEMGGQLDVFYDRAQQEITLLGTLNALRGTYRARGRGFNVEQGTLRFFGTPGINPELDIQTTSRIRTAGRDALNVTANVTGTLIRPRVTLTSDQAGLSEADLIAFMAFGRPAYGLTSGQSQVLGAAGSLLVGQGVTLGNSVLGSAASELGLAYLSITQQDLGGVGDTRSLRGALVLETGRYLAEDFFVTLLLRPLSSAGAGSTLSTFAGLRVDWTASNDYTIQASIEERFFRGRVVGFGDLANTNQKGFGLFFFREWGY